MKCRLGMKAGIMAASFALLGGAIYGAQQPRIAQANTEVGQLRSMKRHSTMTPRKALKKIAWAAAPIDQNKWTKPTTASLTANTARFKSDCAAGTGGPWRHLTVNPEGTGYKSCAIGVPDYDPDTHLGQFKKPLNRLGNIFIRSVGLDYQQASKKVAGNRSKVTANFKCSPAGSPSERGVKTIVVRKSGRATITRCHVG